MPSHRTQDPILTGLPRNHEAEVSVLGSCLQSTEALSTALEILRPEHFYLDGHKKVFAACQALFECGIKVDLVTVAESLIKAGDLDTVGGAAVLVGLVDATPTTANIEQHARIVKDKADLTQIIEKSHQTIARAAGGELSAGEVLEWAEQQLFAISQSRISRDFTPLRTLLNGAFDTIEKLSQSGSSITGIASGFRELDELTAGWQPSDLIVLAGRPSMGKTALGLQLAEYAAVRRRTPVAVFSLEMSKEQVAQRMLCSAARVDSQRVRTGQVHDGDWGKLTTAAGPLSETPISIDDTPAISVTEMRAKARRLRAEGKCELVIVDYLQLIGATHEKGESRQQEISGISRALKAMAKELNVPVIALSQLSRAVEMRTPPRPQLSDLRESGAIEQDADLAMFLYRPSYYKKEIGADGQPFEDATTELILAKQRNGPIGTVYLSFLKNITRFEPLAAPGQQGPA